MPIHEELEKKMQISKTHIETSTNSWKETVPGHLLTKQPHGDPGAEAKYQS